MTTQEAWDASASWASGKVFFPFYFTIPSPAITNSDHDANANTNMNGIKEWGRGREPESLYKYLISLPVVSI